MNLKASQTLDAVAPQPEKNHDMNDDSDTDLQVQTIESHHENDFVRFLLDAKIHPVLIFGTSDSGKTTMLQSLLCYAKGNAKAKLGAMLGDNVFPSNFPGSKGRYADGREFFVNGVKKFSEGTLLQNTIKTKPFFIPVNLTIKEDNAHPTTLKYAFLEGMGEWYEKDKTKVAEFNEFKPEITAILTRFTDPISVILVAPSAHTGDSSKWDYSHECLTNCIKEYQEKRVDKSRDNLLLLASKWDAKFGPDDRSGNFANASAEVLTDEMGKWTFSWASFSAMTGPGGKAIMPYSAGWIKEKNVNPPGQFRDTFDRFNRTLWNWLYGNASHDPSHLEGGRKILFDDVAPPNKVPKGALHYLIGLLLWDRH